MQPASQSTNLGAGVTLECEIDSLPPALISWQHDGTLVTDGSFTMVTTQRSQLLIREVTYASRGLYQCMARNTITNELKYSNTAEITVRGTNIRYKS